METIIFLLSFDNFDIFLSKIKLRAFVYFTNVNKYFGRKRGKNKQHGNVKLTSLMFYNKGNMWKPRKYKTTNLKKIIIIFQKYAFYLKNAFKTK